MLYLLFLCLAVTYNLWKFRKSRELILSTLIEAKSITHREMILSHHFYVFIFEGFLAFIVAHFLSEQKQEMNILGLGAVYLILVFTGFFLYQYFVVYLEKETGLSLLESFRNYLLKELRVNFALILLPILIYSVINLTFQDSIYDEWGSWWFLGIIFNLLFVSVLTITCTVIIMLKLIPNREISEPEYLEIINRRLDQIQMPGMRIRWIETDIKNAFIVGLKLLFFSNQTMFVGKSLRTMLTLEEFDAVICHELAHVANRHIHKRVIDLLKNFLSIVLGSGFLMFLAMAVAYLYWGEDVSLHSGKLALICMVMTIGWVLFNYALFFDAMRAHEFEADAYAVIKLGVSFESMKSALEKLTQPEDLPDYLKKKRKDQSNGIKWFLRYFSTHPDLSIRLKFLQKKISKGLPFNYYVSSAQKIRKLFSPVFHWRFAIPLSIFFSLAITWSIISIKRGQALVSWINQASSQEILGNPLVREKINLTPIPGGPSLIYYIVKKGDPALLDYFLSNGANKGKTLIYITQIKDYAALQKYYEKYQASLTDDEYFLILRKSAENNFVEGYRYLVNAKHFEDLNPNYKNDISRLHHRNRFPASTPKE
jgi:Zn-dependent protease with chaperone function